MVRCPAHCSVLDQASAAWTTSVILEGHAELQMVSLCEGPLLCFTQKTSQEHPTGVLRTGLVLEDANSSGAPDMDLGLASVG